MGEIVNLNKARKARDRAARAETAAANRAKHGRTAAERAAEAQAEARRRALLDGARIDIGPDPMGAPGGATEPSG